MRSCYFCGGGRKQEAKLEAYSGCRVAPQQATGGVAAANGGGSLQQASQAKQPATKQCRQPGRLTSTRQAARARTSTQSMCMVEKQEHTRTRESSPSHSALASNPRKESACVSVAAVRAKIEQLAAAAAAMVAARQRAQATARRRCYDNMQWGHSFQSQAFLRSQLRIETSIASAAAVLRRAAAIRYCSIVSLRGRPAAARQCGAY